MSEVHDPHLTLALLDTLLIRTEPRGVYLNIFSRSASNFFIKLVVVAVVLSTHDLILLVVVLFPHGLIHQAGHRFPRALVRLVLRFFQLL